MFTTDEISRWKVLIVDDEPDSLDVARRVLSFYGANVYTACNGKEGLEVVQQVIPTFVLSDLSMPEMDGWELLHNIRNNTRTRHIPVIALTAHAMVGDRERAMGVGFHYYLTKPLSPFTFLDQLTKLVEAMELPDLVSSG